MSKRNLILSSVTAVILLIGITVGFLVWNKTTVSKETTLTKDEYTQVTFKYSNSALSWNGTVFASDGCTTVDSSNLVKQNSKYVLQYKMKRPIDALCTQVLTKTPISGTTTQELTAGEIENFNTLFDIVAI
jgi:hypothetical protein